MSVHAGAPASDVLSAADPSPATASASPPDTGGLVTDTHGHAPLADRDDDALPDAARNAAARQYQMYVEMAEALVDRRADANKFYLSLNTALVGAAGVAATQPLGLDLQWVTISLSLAGILLCVIWRAILVSQRQIMGLKFEVIHEMEAQLPFQPYAREWAISQTDKRGKPSFARFELRTPLVFMALYVAFAAAQIGALSGQIPDLPGLN